MGKIHYCPEESRFYTEIDEDVCFSVDGCVSWTKLDEVSLFDSYHNPFTCFIYKGKLAVACEVLGILLREDGKWVTLIEGSAFPYAPRFHRFCCDEFSYRFLGHDGSNLWQMENTLPLQTASSLRVVENGYYDYDVDSGQRTFRPVKGHISDMVCLEGNVFYIEYSCRDDHKLLVAVGNIPHQFRDSRSIRQLASFGKRLLPELVESYIIPFLYPANGYISKLVGPKLRDYTDRSRGLLERSNRERVLSRLDSLESREANLKSTIKKLQASIEAVISRERDKETSQTTKRARIDLSEIDSEWHSYNAGCRLRG